MLLSVFSSPMKGKVSLTASVLILLCAAFGPAPSWAQEEPTQEGPQPQRYEDVTWNRIYLYDFKATEEERAMEILSEHLIPVYQKVNVQAPKVVELQTGPWDVMIVATLPDGPSELTWETAPEELELQQAFAEELGEEKAPEILEEYGQAIARETSFLGMSGNRGPAIGRPEPDTAGTD